jgi:energy-coupling factor transport system ATP-binding protein
MIELKGIRVRYPEADNDALAGVSLMFPAGSRTAIMGPNGSGKTTLVSVMASLLTPVQGSVAVTGRVGIVLQNPFLQITSLTVEREMAFGLQNLGVPTGELHRRVDTALEDSGLARLRNCSPSRLSGGEMQRLALAAVLITDPDVLILDEATSLLSPASRRHLLDRVAAEQAQRNLTVVLVTQFPAEAEWCSALIVLKGGMVARHAVPSEVFSDAGEVAALCLPVPPRLLLEAS